MSMSEEWKASAQLALDTFEVVNEYTTMSYDAVVSRAVWARADDKLTALVYANRAVNEKAIGEGTVLVTVRYPWQGMHEIGDPYSAFLHPGYVIDKWGRRHGGLDDCHPGELYLVMRAIEYLTGCEIADPGRM